MSANIHIKRDYFDSPNYKVDTSNTCVFLITSWMVVLPVANCSASPHADALEVIAVALDSDRGTDAAVNVTTTPDAPLQPLCN